MKNNKITAVVYLFVVISLVLIPESAYSGGFASLDNGGQRTAMRATVARGTDLTTIFSNPGGLSRLKGEQLYFSFIPTYIHTKFKLRREDGTYTDSIKPTRSLGLVPFISYGSNFGLDKWTFALSWHFPNLSAAMLPEDAETRYHGIEAYFVNWFMTPTVSYNITPKISIGFGPSYVYAHQYFRVKVDLHEVLAQELPILIPFLERDAEIETRPENDGFIWNFGILLGPWKGWKFGASYMSREILDMEGDLSMEAEMKPNPLLPIEDLILKIEGKYETEKIIPEVVRAGINWQINPKWQIGLDWTWWHHNIIKKSVTHLKGHPLFATISPMIQPKNYSNGYNLGFGVEYRISENWTWMWGCDFDKTPIPDKSFGVDNPTSDFWGVATGTWIKLNKHWDMTLAYDFQPQMERDIDNSETSPPTNAKVYALTQKVAFAFSWRR